MSRRAQENIVAGFVLAFFVAIIVLSLDYSPRARFVPMPVAVLGAMLVTIQLVWQNLRSPDELHVDVLELLTGRARNADKDGDGTTPGARDTAAGTRKQLIAFGMVSLVVATAFVIGQSDVKRLLAYSSVEHMGLLVLGLGVGGVGAIGTLLHVLNNGIAKGMLSRMLADDRALGGSGLVEPPDRRRVRSVLRDLRILGGLREDRLDRIGEVVEPLLGLGLGGLDHQRLVDEEWEVDRRRMDLVVEQPLRDVGRPDAQLLLRASP